ncbi:hypothetical protein [Dysgonomonas termitidis]|uniref:Guanylate cyclase domain-containing protein n=1 Tax=Dysgonomonas termitidis TaxID=1516126 RepID=A0ABV9KYA5_9BACT
MDKTEKEKGQKGGDKNEKQTQIEKYTIRRYVAFFDILGFKNMLQKGTRHAVEQLETLVNYLDGDKNSPFVEDENVKDIVQFRIFSDSIFMYTKDESLTSWRLFTYAVSCFFHHALIRRIPIKGGVAHGYAFIGQPNSKLKNVMCGEAITNAYLIQEELQYIGIVVHHTFEHYLEKTIKLSKGNPDIEDEYLKDSGNFEKVLLLYKEIKTPLKNGIYECLNMNLFRFSAKWAEIFCNDSSDILIDFKLNSPSHSRKYIDNTKKAWDELKKQ